jgi:hypothetical protein
VVDGVMEGSAAMEASASGLLCDDDVVLEVNGCDCVGVDFHSIQEYFAVPVVRMVVARGSHALARANLQLQRQQAAQGWGSPGGEIPGPRPPPEEGGAGGPGGDEDAGESGSVVRGSV